jgi:flagellar basal body-associated protein FliL
MNIAPIDVILGLGCVLALAVPFVLMWLFFRSAVRSGTAQAAPPATQAPPQAVFTPPPPLPAAPALTEERVRQLVREEIQALRAARAAAGASRGSPG